VTWQNNPTGDLQQHLCPNLQSHNKLLVSCQLQMGLPSQALKLTDQSLLIILSHGGAYNQGRALLLFAKCKVAAAAGQPPDVRKKAFNEAICLLNKVKISFQKTEAYYRVKDVLYLQVKSLLRDSLRILV